MKKFVVVVLLALSSTVYGIEQAEELFSQLAPSLYQIRIIDKASGEKSSIGSGFQIDEQGYIATNYHVISSYARHPHKYRMELVDHLGDKFDLTLASVDVINDLAIIKRDATEGIPVFSIANAEPNKGEEIYSLGNPHDLGMIVVPGTYNGLKKESFNDRIHFTGSVNPGMSGGPVVNANAEVVGINVATSGNQIGFLVPHDKLQTLYQEFQLQAPSDINQQMLTQLEGYQKRLITTLLESEWHIKQLGEGMIPTVDVPFIRCWGESNADKPNDLMLIVVANCNLDEDVYVSSNFITGSIEMEFQYMQSKKLSDLKFYQIYQQRIVGARPKNKASKEDVSEYQCHHDLYSPSNEQMDAKGIFCTRAYKKLSGLYDVLYLGVSVDKANQALISHFTIAGVKEDTAMAFTEKFMESVSWN